MKLFQMGRNVNVFWQNDKYSIPEMDHSGRSWLRDFPTCPMQPWLVSLYTSVFMVSRETCFWARIASLPAIRLILSNGDLAKAQMGTLHSNAKIPKAWYKYILLEKSEEGLVLTSRSRRVSSLQRDLWLWVSGFEWPSPSLKWTPDGTGPLTEKGAWRQHSDPWGRRTETWLHAESADPKTQLSQREEKRSWTSVTMSSSPEASSHRALYLLLCMLTSQQRSISFMSRAQWLRTPLWVNNIPKYQSCDWIQPPGKSVGFKEITAASTQDNRPGLFYWVQL